MLSYIDIEAFATANNPVNPKRQSNPKPSSREQHDLAKVSRPQTQQQMTKQSESTTQGSNPQQMS